MATSSVPEEVDEVDEGERSARMEDNVLPIQDYYQQSGKGTGWQHVIELPQSQMTRTQFNQTMHWLLSQDAAAQPNQMLGVLQGDAIPSSKESDNVVNVTFGEIFTQRS